MGFWSNVCGKVCTKTGIAALLNAGLAGAVAISMGVQLAHAENKELEQILSLTVLLEAGSCALSLLISVIGKNNEAVLPADDIFDRRAADEAREAKIKTVIAAFLNAGFAVGACIVNAVVDYRVLKGTLDKVQIATTALAGAAALTSVGAFLFTKPCCVKGAKDANRDAADKERTKHPEDPAGQSLLDPSLLSGEKPLII